jgi:hypothetical protein
MAQTMAAITPAYRMRPLDLGDILDEAFRIYRAHFGLMVTVAFIASIPGILTGIGAGSGGLFSTFQQYSAISQGNTFIRPDTTLLPLTFVGIGLGILMFPISTAAPVFAACAVTLGLPVTVGSVLRAALRNYFRVWVLGIIVIVLEFFMVLVISIPVVLWVLVGLAFRYQVLYLEHGGIGGAMSRSWALVKGSWWRTFGILVLVFIILFVLSLVLQAMFGFISLLAPAGLLRQALAGILTAATQAVLLPFGALATTLLYLDQRVRKESLDLQLMAGQAGQPVAAPPAPTGDMPPAWSDNPPTYPG